MKLTLPIPPPINRYWRTLVFGLPIAIARALKAKGIHVRAAPVLSAEAREYKARMQAIADEGRMFDKAAGPIEGPCVLVVRFHRPRRAGDIDGRIKPMLDALQGLAFANDSQLVALFAINGHDPKSPRAEVQVWPVASQEARSALLEGVAATLGRPEYENAPGSHPSAL